MGVAIMIPAVRGGGGRKEKKRKEWRERRKTKMKTVNVSGYNVLFMHMYAILTHC